jgi:ubiquitin-conjugating enzyme E2 S
MAMRVTPEVIKQLTKELADLHGTPPEGIRVVFNEQDITDIQADIDGPTGTPFEGGLFRLKLSLPNDFPASPPKGFFLTKIWHPNVSKAGEICVNVLKKDWKPDLGIKHVLLVIRCLLIEPFPESALNEEAGKALLENYEGYSRYARMMTSLHAQPPKRPGAQPLTAANPSLANTTADTAAVADASPSSSKVKAQPRSSSTAAAASKAKKSLKRL